MPRRRIWPRSAPSAWQQSIRFKKIGRAAILAWNRTWAQRPKCGAKTKNTGDPCQRAAMANGRCHFHGGRTPSGADWHKPRYPGASAPNAEARLNRKLRDLDRAAKKRAKRIAAMTPEERAKYDHWHLTHKPGSPAARAADRERRRQAKEAQSVIEKVLAPGREPTPSEESRILGKQIAELERQLAARNNHDIFG